MSSAKGNHKKPRKAGSQKISIFLKSIRWFNE